MFKMWKRWANLAIDPDGSRNTLLHNGPVTPAERDAYPDEVVLRAEADDKKMRDVFDAIMRIKYPSESDMQTLDLSDLERSLDEACERARLTE